MSASLSGIPVEKRRQLAATLGLFAVLFIAVGAVAATGSATAAVRMFVVVSLVVGVLLALVAWGVALSVKGDRAEQRLDTAVEDAIAAHGTTLRGLTCGCGHEHDPDELHVTDNPCANDGHGVGCTHSCETCVLATMQRGPEAGSADRPRPAPSGRPRPTGSASR